MTLERISILAFVSIAGLLALDIIDDLTHGSDISHVTIELFAFAVCFITLGVAVYRLLSRWINHTSKTQDMLIDMRAQRDKWRLKAKGSIDNLSKVIDEQFDNWGLTAAEKEVGLLILKGLSHKEIADVRNCSERTIRQQATALYSKAGITSKSHLAAFFLEDLMVPIQRVNI